jgi:hypothetical protein
LGGTNGFSLLWFTANPQEEIMKAVSRLWLILPFTFLLVSQASAQQIGLVNVDLRNANILSNIANHLNVSVSNSYHCSGADQRGGGCVPGDRRGARERDQQRRGELLRAEHVRRAQQDRAERHQRSASVDRSLAFISG